MDNQTNGSEVLNMAEAARRVGRSGTWLHRMIQIGHVRLVREEPAGKQVRRFVDLAEVREASKNSRRSGTAPPDPETGVAFKPIHEVARDCNRSRSTLLGWIDAGLLPSKQLKDEVYVDATVARNLNKTRQRKLKGNPSRHGAVTAPVPPLTKPRALQLQLPQRRRDKSAENLRLKHFGSGTLMFLGSNQRHHFVEWSADLAIVDELDHCDASNLALLPDRLKASPYKQLFRVGNPTTPNGEIAEAYAAGDRRQWHMRCPHCSAWQSLDWFQHVVRTNDLGGWTARDTEGLAAVLRGDRGADLRPVCTTCYRPFARPRVGAWIPESPGVPRRSYRISRLDVLSERIWDLFLEWMGAQGKERKLERFFNSNLGLPYQRSGSRLTADMIERAATGAPIDGLGRTRSSRRSSVIMGVDVGAMLNVQIDVVEQLELPTPEAAADLASRILADDPDSGVAEAAELRRAVRRRTVWAGTVRDFESLDDLIDRYGVRITVIDALPETRKAKELRDRHRGRDCAVWMCTYHGSNKVGGEEYAMVLDHESRVVQVDRTQVLDATLDELLAGLHVLPSDVSSIADYVSQMTASERVLDDSGSRFVWREGTKADHYRHSDVYCRVAMDVLARGGSFDVV